MKGKKRYGKGRKNKFWTMWEIEIIRYAYPTTPANIIAFQMSVKTEQVEAVIRRYKIKKNAIQHQRDYSWGE